MDTKTNQTAAAKSYGSPRNQAVGTRNADEPTVSDIATDIGETLSTYARKRPEVVAMWSFGIGFVLAWKLKPW